MALLTTREIGSEPSSSNRSFDFGISHQPMLLVSLALALGIVIDFACCVPKTISLGIAILSLAVCAVLWRIQTRSVRLENARSFALLISIAAIGCSWHHLFWNDFAPNDIGFAAAEDSSPCAVELQLCSEPRYAAIPSGFSDVPSLPLTSAKEQMQTRFRTRALRVRDGETWRPVSGNAELVMHCSVTNLRSGDHVRVFGHLVRPAPPTNPGQFDFSNHYRRQRLLAFVHAYHSDSVEIVSRTRWGPSLLLSSLRRHFDLILWKYVGENEASFASAILLGNRRQMEKSRRDKFVETGTAHLLAISGLHVGILAGVFLFLLRGPYIQRRWCLWGTIFFVLFYAWLTEFRPPVTRAAILIALYSLGRLFGNKGFSINLLCAAGILVLAINPTDLFSIGPQLSFLAVATLTVGQKWIFPPASTDPLKRLIANTRPLPVRWFQWFLRWLRAAVYVSGAIWLIGLPLVANRFHVVAYISMLVNPLLLVPITLALYTGLATLVTGLIGGPVARVCGYLCDRCLALIEHIVLQAQGISWSHIWTAGPHNISVAIFYLGLVFFAAAPIQKNRGKFIALFIAGWFLLGWWLPTKVSNLKQRPLECTFIDVGHGTSVLINFPNGEHWLYDAGAMGSAQYGANNIASVLWYNGVEHIDTLVISHADADHYNSAPIIAEKFSIGRVVISTAAKQNDSAGFKNLLELFASMKVSVEITSRGDRWNIGQHTKVSVLSPPPAGLQDNDNANSIVLMVDTGQQKFLLPGDLEKLGMDFLLGQPKIDFDLIMAAHHGSKNSVPAEMMQWSTPEWVVISGNRHRVSDATAARFLPSVGSRRVLRTDHCGAIRFQFNEGGADAYHWDVDSWKPISLDQAPSY